MFYSRKVLSLLVDNCQGSFEELKKRLNIVLVLVLTDQGSEVYLSTL
jgi:hypothetical protein